MTDRIKKLLELTLEGEMIVNARKTEFDVGDLALSKTEMESKRLCEYILNQEPKITEYSCMTGIFTFDNSVVGDAFHRRGHKVKEITYPRYFLKPVENLSTFESQHATADYSKILKKGIRGVISDIEESIKKHTEAEEMDFLIALKRVADAFIGWAHKCSDRARMFSENVQNEEYKKNLVKLSNALKRIPENAPESFYEAVLCVYLCFAADPDSVGTLDRYLYPFYKADVESGILTREEAAEYLQELFLMLQAYTPINSPYFTRGGQSHFCVGGYLPNGEDGFTELSRLIVESMVELPTWIPQVTLRWTKKTSREVFRFMLDLERRDPHKRIAFQNDEKRIKCYTEICKIPYERAVSYTTVGCNEPAFVGSISGSTTKINFARSIETLFHKKSELIEDADSFEDFFEIFKEELFTDLMRAYEYDNFFNKQRAMDVNYISSLVFNDCIENAKSLTQGGGSSAICSPMCIGITNVIDSLCTVKQFVFDEELFTMSELISALKANWSGYEDMRTLILKKGKFFGNDDDTSGYVSQRLYSELYEFLKDKTNIFGYHYLIGDLIGYNPHHKWFGEKMSATPDGRYSGDALKFGLGQGEGRDREGLSALLNSIAKVDPNGIGCGTTVTNITIDEQLIRNDDSFEKLVDMLLTYFESGGVHFQLTYISEEDLVSAKKNPQEYKHLRVRVSGFSENFVRLEESIQDDVISRTVQKR